MAGIIQQIDIAHLAIHHANRFPQSLCEPPPDEKVLIMLLRGKRPPQPPHKHFDQPRLHRILLDVHADRLRHRPAPGKNLVKPRVMSLVQKRCNLLLRPEAGEQAHNRNPARENAGGVLRFFRGRQGRAVQVREVQRFISFEEARIREEGLALVVS